MYEVKLKNKTEKSSRRYLRSDSIKYSDYISQMSFSLNRQSEVIKFLLLLIIKENKPGLN
jgi:hypothetical protein